MTVDENIKTYEKLLLRLKKYFQIYSDTLEVICTGYLGVKDNELMINYRVCKDYVEDIFKDEQFGEQFKELAKELPESISEEFLNECEDLTAFWNTCRPSHIDFNKKLEKLLLELNIENITLSDDEEEHIRWMNYRIRTSKKSDQRIKAKSAGSHDINNEQISLDKSNEQIEEVYKYGLLELNATKRYFQCANKKSEGIKPTNREFELVKFLIIRQKKQPGKPIYYIDLAKDMGYNQEGLNNIKAGEIINTGAKKLLFELLYKSRLDKKYINEKIIKTHESVGLEIISE